MTETTHKWKEVFCDITTDGVYEMCEINAYQLASHLEELYLQNNELCDKIEKLELDNQLLKSYIKSFNDTEYDC